MIITQLIETLKKYPPNSQIFISNDSEGNEIKDIDIIATTQLPKSNNKGTYDAIIIYPTDTTINT